MRTFYLCLFVFLSSTYLASSQTANLEHGGEMKATTDHALQPIGSEGSLLYFMNIGMGRKVADYEIMVYDRSDLNTLVRKTDLGKVLGDIKAHDVAYYYLQNGKIYLVTISKSLYFGSILTSEGQVISSNIPLFAAGMTKASVHWAEVIETTDHSQLALVSRKSVKGKVPDEFTLIVFDDAFKSAATHKFKLPEALGDANTTDIHYARNGCVYLAFLTEKSGGKAFVYDPKSKALKEYELGEQDDDLSYLDGQFHEGPDGAVWLGFSRGPGCVNSYSLFKHNGGNAEPELIETYTFSEAQLEKSKVKVLIGKGCLGLPSGTRLQQMVFHPDGSMHAIFEGHFLQRKETINTTTNVREVDFALHYTDLFCVALSNTGKAGQVTVVHKNQNIHFGPLNQKSWTLGPFRYDENLLGFGLSFVKCLSFHAWSNAGELQLLFNDDDGNGTKNEPYPDLTNNLKKANLVQVSLKNGQVSKSILFASDTYELIFLPGYAIQLSDGSMMSTATSKKGGLTSVYFMNKE